jgi:anti-sigma B factor antagonist
MHTPRLRKTIQNYLKSNSSGVVVDFNEVNYMDSSGVATLVEGYQLANDQGKKFAVSRMVQEQVWHILEITRLDELFENHESPETAAERLKRDRT